MADYRDITQEYAKGAIKTVILISAGSIIAILNQLPEISKLASLWSLKLAMTAWVFGIVFGVLSWILAFKSTIELGNHDEWKQSPANNEKSEAFRNTGNQFSNYAAFSTSLSLIFFFTGCLVIIFALKAP